MSVRVEDDEERGRYQAFVGDRRAGYMTYRRRADLVALDHTQVDERFEGEGVGSALADRALNDAREAGLAVYPFCEFVNEYIQRHPAYVELVPEGERERFGLAEAS